MKRFAGIQAVTFDVGNTLIKPWPSVGHIFAEVAAAHGHGNCSPEELNRRFIEAFRNHGGEVNTKPQWAQIVDATFAGLLLEPPGRSFFPDLYARFTRAYTWQIFDDVGPTLTALRQRGLKLGVISNWDDRLRPLLHALKLANLFDTIIVSCEVGTSKPAALIFETAVNQLGVSASAILHVGDSFKADVAGARATGFNALQIEREERITTDWQIKSLAELLARV